MNSLNVFCVGLAFIIIVIVFLLLVWYSIATIIAKRIEKKNREKDKNLS